MGKKHKSKRRIFIWAFVICLGFFFYKAAKKINLNFSYDVGQPIDSLNRVIVFFNGGVDNVTARNVTSNNYNVGLKYQCVEFVKRYYLEKLEHEMPDSYGHAKDFFDENLKDGQFNQARGLVQYRSPSVARPEADDILVLSGTLFNPYGHVAIVTVVMSEELEIIQQNPGPFSGSRESFGTQKKNGRWSIDNSRVLGWLRKQ